jgi:heme-degrading monooxygenase HmoA
MGSYRPASAHRIIGAGGSPVIAVIFEFTPAEGRFPEYMDLVGTLKADLETADGFISLERFESITTKGKFVSLQFWRDEEAVRKWRNLQRHREAQKKGRAGIFRSYRLRIASVVRDYTMDERGEAPADSLSFHSQVHG